VQDKSEETQEDFLHSADCGPRGFPPGPGSVALVQNDKARATNSQFDSHYCVNDYHSHVIVDASGANLCWPGQFLQQYALDNEVG
jgi:hypothetical protein